jgi:outer membrane protein OmpA-like peptidoglycan-associated protein
MVAVLAVGVLGAVGCATPNVQEEFQKVNNNNMWPERNGYLARQAVLHPFEVQQNNAAVVNDVVLNSYFDNGSDKLNGVGRSKLDQLARKMPAPNGTVFLQTSNDVAYDEKSPEKTANARGELDQKRASSVLAYLNARPNRGTAYSVQAIDIDDPSTNAEGPATAVRGLRQQFRSGISGGISGGNPAGAGGGLASNTLGVTPMGGAPSQGGGTSGTGGR